MKRISLYMTLICIAFVTGMSVSFATTTPTLSDAAPIVGTTAVGENAGTLIFQYETGVPPATNEVSINANTLIFTGTFWTTNAGWCTFSEQGTKLTTRTGNASMTGFAWCQNAGWISFNPTGSIATGGDVYLDNTTGIFHGFAWSENLGWINMDGLVTDITPPSDANFKAFAASWSMTLTLNDPSPVGVGINLYKLDLADWNSTAVIQHLSSTQNFPNLDVRTAKSYYLKITDPYGNISEGNVQVVANIPQDSLGSSPITGATEASTYTGTFANSVVADGAAVHSLNLTLRDQYGNPVINESLGWVPIKTVNVNVAFNNQVHTDQVLNILNAIVYPIPSNTFWLTSGIASNTGTDNNGATWDYSLKISSYAPTSSGYAFTTANNNISLQKLSYEVTAPSGVLNVGAVGETEKKDKFGTNNLKFSPALYIGSVSNLDGWTIRQGYPTTFIANLVSLGTTTWFNTVRVAHLLDIDSNILMSYQAPSVTTSFGTKKCDGFMETISTFNGSYTTSPTECSRYPSSNVLIEPTSWQANMKFSWTPKIIVASPANSVVKYASEISYKNGSADVKYPSFARSTNSSTLANWDMVAMTNGVINQSVKILGMTNSRNTIDILQGNDTSKVGSLTRTDIKNAIHKNVETMTKWGVSWSAKYVVYTGDKNISSWPDNNKDTIIIKWGDLTIAGNIGAGTSIRGIIVLKDDAGNRGNIYIQKNVSNIAAVLYADKSIISGTSISNYYSDALPSAQTATGQLFIEGSLISDNTIGGASMTPLKCPYNVTGCTDEIAKHYDLNFFRFYDGTNGPAAWVPAGSEAYPFVIKYDNRLQTAPPPGFKMAQ